MPTSLLQKVRKPVAGASNWSAGAQPSVRAPGATNPAPYTPRNLGTMTSADLDRSPTGTVLGQRPTLTGAPVRSGYAEYKSPLTRVPPQAMAPTMTPSSALARTPAAPVAAPTTIQAQQTESANPLTGDTNANAGGTSAPVNPGQAMGFSRAGASTPAGQDAMPEQSTQEKIGAATSATLSSIGGKPTGGIGLYRRRFSTPQAANMYTDYVRRLFPSNV